MKILTPGHKYELQNFDQPASPGQTLQFIEKRPNPLGAEGALELVNDGTTNEEVLKVLIDRLGTMNAKLPNRDTSIAITHLEDALMRLERRTRERQSRGLEGKMLA